MADHTPSPPPTPPPGDRRRAAKQAAGPAASHRNQPQPDATDASTASERLTRAAAEIHGMLDGSVRCLLLAQRELAGQAPDSKTSPLERAHEHVLSAADALHRVSQALHDRLTGHAPSALAFLGEAIAKPSDHVAPTFAEAADHALDVLRSRAREARIELRTELDRVCAQIDAGPLYAVILCGLVNAIESIEAARRPGSVVLSARPIDATGNLRRLRIEILDDGVGLPGQTAGNDLFAHGFTTKQGASSAGLGLALSRQLVTQAGGTIDLRQRADIASGAALVIVVPIASPARSIPAR